MRQQWSRLVPLLRLKPLPPSQVHSSAASAQWVMDLPRDVIAALNQAASDSDLTAKATLLSQIADVLACDVSSASSGFLNEFAHLNAELLAQGEKERVIDRQRAKLADLDVAKDELRKQIAIAKKTLTAVEVQRMQKKLEEMNSKFHEEHSAAKTLERQAVGLGYSEDISDDRMRKLQARELALKQEVEELQKEVSPFEGIEATNEAFRDKIRQVSYDIENLACDFAT